MSNNNTTTMTQAEELRLLFGITNSTTARSANKATPGQLEFITRLCEQKKQPLPENMQNFTFDEASAEIERLKSIFPVSAKQIDLINKTIAELEAAKVHVDAPDINTLTGGREGTASKFITELLTLRKIWVKTPITDAQWERGLLPMVGCIDIDFESAGVARYETLDNGFKRFKTVPELEEACRNAFSFTSASEFIGKWTPTLNEWRSTRIRPGQATRILQLLERTGGTLSNLELFAFSQDQADAYIQELQTALSKPNVTSLESEAKFDEPKSNIRVTVDDIEKELNDLLHALIALSNYEPVETVEQVLSDKQLFAEYIKYLLEEELISIEQLVELTDGGNCVQFIFQ